MHATTAAQRIDTVGVELRRVAKTFAGGVNAVADLDLDISPGEFVAFLGPSGCGKTTLLRIIAGLERPTSGTVRLTRDDHDIRDARMGYVFQDAHLLPWRNVLGNAALPLELSGMPKSQRVEIAQRALAQVGLTEALHRYPAQLSGGMRMRVSLARALVAEPELLLLDEPFAALDALTRESLDEQLRKIWAVRGITVIFVTHSIAEATFLAERAIVFSPRPARVLLDHHIDLPDVRPREMRTDTAFAREMQVLYEALRGSET